MGRNEDDEGMLKLAAAARGYALRQKRDRDADDFAQEVVRKRLEGQRGTLKQLFIDYLRSEYGDSRNAAGRGKLEASYHASNSAVVATGIPAERLVSDMEFEALIALITRHSGWFTQRDRALLILRHKWGFSTADCAEVFGVSQALISTYFGELTGRIKVMLARTRPKKTGGRAA